MVARKPRPARRAPAANPVRGEHDLDLAGVVYRLRPTFTAVVSIEQALETSLLALFRKANAGLLRYADAGVVVAELIRAGAEPGDTLTANVSDEEIGALIFEEGMPKVQAALVLVLGDAITGGRDRSGKAKAPATVNPATGAAT
jgi:hypothetical protein